MNIWYTNCNHQILQFHFSTRSIHFKITYFSALYAVCYKYKERCIVMFLRFKCACTINKFIKTQYILCIIYFSALTMIYVHVEWLIFDISVSPTILPSRCLITIFIIQCERVLLLKFIIIRSTQYVLTFIFVTSPINQLDRLQFISFLFF